MKKLRNFLLLFVLLFIAIKFSINTKPAVEEQERYSNEEVFNFLENKGNRMDVYAAAIKLNEGSSANTCVYFIAEVMRRNNFNVPNETNNISQIIDLLKEKGWRKQSNYEDLKPGDICFTTDGEGNKNGMPTHTYVFMKWVKEGSYDYAYICDNQAKDYKGMIYHIRNIGIIDKANGSSKDAFAFFMKRS
jgi:hypothetical protein